MANYKIEEIEGIGSSKGEAFRKANITTTDKLLQAGRTKAMRKALAEATGIDEKTILKCVNQVDLFRIKGVGKQYAELLERAGVDTVVELATRKPENLEPKLKEVNEKYNLCNRVPPLKSIQQWVEIAKTLPRGVEY